MRTLAKMALSVAVAAFVASVSLAQPGERPGGGRGMGQSGPALLLNKSVQEELKLTDDQKADLHKVSEKQTDAMKKAYEDHKGDREKVMEAMKTIHEDTNKSLAKTVASLKPDQAKRFKQIEIQVEGVRIFTADEKDEVAQAAQKSLKLTDKEKEAIKAQATDLEKDMREIFKDVGRDPEKRAEAQKKVADLRKKAMDTITKSLTADQQKAWKEMTGEHFDYKPEFPGGFGPRPEPKKGSDKKGDKF